MPVAVVVVVAIGGDGPGDGRHFRGGGGGGERLQALLSQYILFIYERDEVQHTARSRC